MMTLKFPVMLSKEKMNDNFGEALVVYLVLCTDGMDRFWKVPDNCSPDLYNDPIEKYTLEKL